MDSRTTTAPKPSQSGKRPERFTDDPTNQTKRVPAQKPGDTMKAQTYITTDDRVLFVSTVPSVGGSAPLDCAEDDYWKSETCAWEIDPETKARKGMIFGPDYHTTDDVMAMHLRAIPAVVAGCAYIRDLEETTND
jgi:hypothetical protein